MWGYVLAVVGFVPLAAGVFDFCVFAPLASYPFQGPRLRESVREQAFNPSKSELAISVYSSERY